MLLGVTKDASEKASLWLVVVLAFVFCLPMILTPDGFLSGDAYRDNDWLTDRFFDLAARQTLLEEGAFPLRSHLIGGGYPTIGQPFDGSWAPTLLSVLLLGPVLGVKLNLLLLLLLGSWGVWRLARDWIALEPRAALFATAVFACSGWLPSMMLVGFWPQALYMAVPACLALLLAPRHPAERVISGFLLFLLLQQAGNAFVATVGFLFVALWVTAAEREGTWRGGLPLIPLLGTTSALAFSYRYGQPVYLLLAPVAIGLWWRFSTSARGFVQELTPLLRAFVLVLFVAATLGVGKLVPLASLMKDARYEHADNLPPSAWPAPPADRGEGAVLDPDRHDEHFYSSIGDLLVGLTDRAPAEGTYVPPPDPPQGRELLDVVDRRSATREYEYLGLTWGVLLLALLGAGMAGGPREPWTTAPRRAVLLLFLGSVAVCMGPHLLPDVHFLLAGGLPWFRGLSQPIKYYNFFILLPAVLLAGVAAHEGLRLAAGRGVGIERVASAVLVALVAWPFVQNAPIWGDRFAEPMPEAWACDGCAQIKQIGHASWVGEDAEVIQEWSHKHRLRERRRPSEAREYDNALRRVGTIDWYGTLELPEPAIPSHWVTSTGRVLPNEGYPGAESWALDGASVSSPLIGSSSVRFTVTGPGRVIVNQAWLEGFVTNVGAVERDASGLLSVRLPEGNHVVEVRYRPRATILALLGSLLALVGWGVVFQRWRRR